MIGSTAAHPVAPEDRFLSFVSAVCYPPAPMFQATRSLDLSVFLYGANTGTYTFYVNLFLLPLYSEKSQEA
jgi:hypothetical protein